jgi:uncharacterized protein YbcI
MATYAAPERERKGGGLDTGRTLAAISNELVRLLAKLYGHGPTRARTLMVEDVVVCRMLDPFTIAERTLLERGRGAEVRQLRAAFHEATRASFTAIVERNLGRRVVGFVADVDVDANLAALVFFLTPAAGQRGAMNGR